MGQQYWIGNLGNGSLNVVKPLEARKTQERKTRHQAAGVENGGAEINDVARIPKNKPNMLQDKPIKSCLSVCGVA